jgi:hypothetical protein
LTVKSLMHLALKLNPWCRSALCFAAVDSENGQIPVRVFGDGRVRVLPYRVVTPGAVAERGAQTKGQCVEEITALLQNHTCRRSGGRRRLVDGKASPTVIEEENEIPEG